MSPPSHADHPLLPPGRKAGGTRDYPSRDYLCLVCLVPDDCAPASIICLWRTDRRKDGEEGEFELLCAVEELAIGHPAAAADVATLMRVAPSALAPTIRRAVEAGWLAEHGAESGAPRLQLTARGRKHLSELRNAEPELELSTPQRDCYHVLAAVRDLLDTGRATDALLARLLRRRDRSVASSLRRLDALELVDYRLGQIALTDAGQHLLVTLQAYAINLRPGPRLLIRARDAYHVQATRMHLPTLGTHHTRRS
jgi:Mn-dependent DtxR family transcriptional regulator